MTSHSYSGNTKLMDNSAQQDQNIQTTPVQPIQTPPPPQIQQSNDNKPERGLILAILCFFFGIPQILLPLIILLFVVPNLNNLTNELGTDSGINPLFYIVSVILFLTGTANVYFGVLSLKSKKSAKLAIAVIIVSLIIQAVFIISTLTYIINPIYRVVGEVNSTQQNIPTPTPNEPVLVSGWFQHEGYQLTLPEEYYMKKESSNSETFSISRDNISGKYFIVNREITDKTDPCLLEISTTAYPNSSCTSINEYRVLDWGTDIPPFPMGPLTNTYSLINNEMVYEITFLGFDKPEEKDQILSTLRFTEGVLKTFTGSDGVTRQIIKTHPEEENEFVINFWLDDKLISTTDLDGISEVFVSENMGPKYILIKISGWSHTGDFVLVTEDGEEIKIDFSKMGLGTTIPGQHGLHFGNWVGSTTNFTIKAISANGNEYETTFDAITGKQVGETKITTTSN